MQSKDDIELKILEIESAMGSADFWSDKDKAQAILKEYQNLKQALAGGEGLVGTLTVPASGLVYLDANSVIYSPSDLLTP